MDDFEEGDYPQVEKSERGFTRAQRQLSASNGQAANGARVCGADDVDVADSGSLVYATREGSHSYAGRGNEFRRENLTRRNGNAMAEDLEEEAVTREGRGLLARYILAEVDREGSPREREMEAYTGFTPGVGGGSSLMQQDQIVDALGRIGDAIEADRELNSMIASVLPEATWETFLGVARTLFAQEINWGRIVALFYFACRMVRRNLDSMPMVSQILDWATWLIKLYAAHWIVRGGGWVLFFTTLALGFTDNTGVQCPRTWSSLRCGMVQLDRSRLVPGGDGIRIWSGRVRSLSGMEDSGLISERV